MLKKNSNISVLTYASETPVSGFYIRTRLLVKALSIINESVNTLDYTPYSKYCKMPNKHAQNIQSHVIKCISLEPSGRLIPLITASIGLQVESLKTLTRAKLLRKSHIVIFTSCQQLFPAVLSKMLGAKLVLDINDVNLRVAMRTPKFSSRFLRYVGWLPLEKICCRIADIILVNKEDEGTFLETFYNIPAAKIFLLKTSLDEGVDLKPKMSIPEVTSFQFEGKKVVLYLANMHAFMNYESGRYVVERLAVEFHNAGDEFRDVLFVIAGIGSEAFHPSTPNVITTGKLSGEAIDALVQRADVCIDPSIIAGGVKTKIQHYLKKGKVIVTQPSGLEGINLYDRKDLAVIAAPIQEYADKLKFVLQNLNRFKPLAKNNCEIYERQFSWSTFAEQVNELLKKLNKKV